ncbi:MAG: T9SS type A sorting domain-containing protein [bacterium]
MKRFFLSGIFLLFTGLLFAQWRQTAGPEGGNITSLACQGDTFFAAASSCLFVSHDGAATWSRAVTGLPATSFLSVVLRDSHVVAGTYGSGVYRSLDGGTEWTKCNNGLANLNIRSLAIHGNDLFAGSDAGLFVSSDFGSTWNEAGGFSNRKVFSLLALDIVIYAGTEDGGFYLSEDGGSTWTARNDGLPASDILSIAGDGAGLIAGTAGKGVYLMNGNTWVPVTNGIPSSAIARSLTSTSAALFAGTYGDGIFRSSDHGNSWTAVNTYLHNPLVNTVTASGETVFAGTDGGGVYITENNGETWYPTNRGMVGTQVSAILISGVRTFAGTAGAGISLSTDNGYNWSTVNNGLESLFIPALEFFGTNILAATKGSGFFISGNDGSSWVARNYGLTNPYLTALVAKDSVIFAGTWGGGIFRSADTGRNWSPASQELSGLQVRCMEADQERIYAGTWGEGIFASSDQGTSWNPINSGLSSLRINCIVPHATLLFTGTADGVFRSSDGGNHWIPVGGEELPVCEVNSLLFYQEAVFAGTAEHGIFLSYDYGDHWKPVNEGLSDSVVNFLSLNNKNLFAGSGSGGVWRAALSDIFTIVLSPDSVLLEREAGSRDTLFIQTAVDWSLAGPVPSWLSVSKTYGTGDDTIFFEALQENTGDLSRETVLYLFSGVANPVTFKVVQKGRTTSSGEISNIKIIIYPNPTFEKLLITSELPMEHIQIFSITGEILRQAWVNSGQVTIDLSEEKRGLYFLVISGRDWSACRKIIVQ